MSQPKPKIKAKTISTNSPKTINNITNFLAVPAKRELSRTESVILLNQLKQFPGTRGLLRKNTTIDVTLEDDEFEKVVDGELERLKNLNENALEFTSRKKNLSIAPINKDGRQEGGWLTTISEDLLALEQFENEQATLTDTNSDSFNKLSLITKTISTTTGLINYTCLGKALYHTFNYRQAHAKIIEDNWPTVYLLANEKDEEVDWEIIKAPSHMLPGKTYNFKFLVGKSYSMQIGNEVYEPSEVLGNGFTGWFWPIG